VQHPQRIASGKNLRSPLPFHNADKIVNDWLKMKNFVSSQFGGTDLKPVVNGKSDKDLLASTVGRG
jgi:hypothetical protein